MVPGAAANGELGYPAKRVNTYQMPLLEKPFYRYDLRVDVPPTEVAVLVDALAGERFTVKDRLGWDSLKEQIEREHRITIEVLSDEAWADFERDIQTLSVYLSEPISGREVHVAPSGDQPDLRGWIILGRRGETARIPLSLGWDEDANMLVDHGLDRVALERHWSELPAWVKDALGPEIRAQRS
jgi:hypothetical protein